MPVSSSLRPATAPEKVGVVAGGGHQGLHDPQQPRSGIDIGQGAVHHRINGEPELPVKRCKDQFLFVREVPEQCSWTHARRRCNGLQRNFRAEFAEALARRRNDLVHIPRCVGAERLAGDCEAHAKRLAMVVLPITVTGG